MLLATLSAAAAGVFSMAWGASQWRPAVALTNCDTSTAGLDAGETQLLQLINSARTAKGFSPVKVSPNLTRAAAWKSEDSSASGAGFSHVDSKGRSAYQRAIDCDYAGGGAAEDIAYGFSSASDVFAAWMNSPMGHACPIDGTQVGDQVNCNPSMPGYFVVVGIGFNPSKSAWTLMFGSYDDSGQSDPGGGGGSGSGSATPTPFPPTSTPIPRFSTPTQPAATPTQFVPAPNDSYKYPTFVPIRRASIPMIAAE